MSNGLGSFGKFHTELYVYGVGWVRDIFIFGYIIIPKKDYIIMIFLNLFQIYFRIASDIRSVIIND